VLTFVLTLLGMILAAAFGLAVWSNLIGWRQRRKVPMLGQVIDLPEAKVHYIDWGSLSAPPVVLVHGISSTMQVYTYALAERLAKTHRVIAIDLPGYGYSRRASDRNASLVEQARILGDFIDSLGLQQPVVVGHSMGGAITLALAVERQDRLGAIALLAPLTQFEAHPPPLFRGLEIRSALLRHIVGHLLAVPMGRRHEALALSIAFAPEAVPGDMERRGGGALGQNPRAFITASTDLVAMGEGLRARVTRYAGTLTLPRGILCGGADDLLRPAVHGRPLAAQGFVYEELPGRGHILPITAAEDCAVFIEKLSGMVTRTNP
jgi:pimeloyl-ACP methyl ester carboxylesterase